VHHRPTALLGAALTSLDFPPLDPVKCFIVQSQYENVPHIISIITDNSQGGLQ
jgi:hypothetical protein